MLKIKHWLKLFRKPDPRFPADPPPPIGVRSVTVENVDLNRVAWMNGWLADNPLLAERIFAMHGRDWDSEKSTLVYQLMKNPAMLAQDWAQYELKRTNENRRTSMSEMRFERVRRMPTFSKPETSPSGYRLSNGIRETPAEYSQRMRREQDEEDDRRRRQRNSDDEHHQHQMAMLNANNNWQHQHHSPPPAPAPRQESSSYEDCRRTAYTPSPPSHDPPASSPADSPSPSSDSSSSSSGD